MTAERPLRADAARNRSRILEAADRQIVAHGPEVRMEAIAEEAGVAVGTLYRHFPTKDALVAAVVEAHLERIMTEVEATADRMEAGADALVEFRRFLLGTVELAASDKAAKAAARELGAQYDIARPIERGTAAMERIIKAGKQSGALRADLAIDDFFLLFATVPVDQPLKARERWMELVLNGIAAAPVRSQRLPGLRSTVRPALHRPGRLGRRRIRRARVPTCTHQCSMNRHHATRSRPGQPPPRTPASRRAAPAPTSQPRPHEAAQKGLLRQPVDRGSMPRCRYISLNQPCWRGEGPSRRSRAKVTA